MPPTDMGPLPLGDRQDRLQQLSLKALRNRLPEDKFLFRDERVDDKGVDGALEVKFETRVPKKGTGEDTYDVFTNCRAQAQLKSTDKSKQNVDGSVSYAIETSNLNYLLNGPSPMYFLWISATDEVRYAWARDEWRRLDADNPDWQKQGEFTIRFRDVLDAAAVDAISERIVREARFDRGIHETLARSAPAESVVVRIDTKTLQSTDPQQVYAWLMASGMTIVSGGYGQQVSDWYDLLNPDVRREARVRLVVGYAEASLGKYFSAAGHLAAAAMRRTDLTLDDAQFLDYLRGVCDYQTGRVDLDEYLRRECERAGQLTGVRAAEHRLEALRQRRLREQDQSQRASLLGEMRAAAGEIMAARDSSPANKLQARIIILAAEGDGLGAKFIEDVSHIQTMQAIGQPVGQAAQQAVAGTSSDWSRWQAEASRIIDDATALGNPILFADALTARLTVCQAILQFQQMDSVWNERPFAPPEETLLGLMGDAQQAMEIYAKAGSLEGETRAKLLLADLYDFRGQQSAAKDLAEGALVVAEAMGYPRLTSLARERIDGQTTLQRFIALATARKAADEDVLLANESDEALRGPARHTLETLNLPADRLPVLEREWIYYRQIARQRVGWCRHLDLIEGPRYALPPAACFASDPPRACQCQKHGYRSAIECADGETAINAFKGAYCDGCPDRSPKSQPTS